jgi:hypothetical protein
VHRGLVRLLLPGALASGPALGKRIAFVPFHELIGSSPCSGCQLPYAGVFRSTEVVSGCGTVFVA